jgi:AcrR family transcriptional regulator
MTDTAPDEAVVLGLRERKRRATSRSIQFSVLRLAAERGLQQVTIEEISRVADVSPRTFFNYFPSKEAAMVGENLLEVQPELIEKFVRRSDGGDMVDGLLELMQQMALLGADDRELHQLRRRVLRDYPELFAIRVAGIREFEPVLAEAIERRLRHAHDGLDSTDTASTGAASTDATQTGAAPARTGDSPTDQARLTALVAIATMRHAFTLWTEAADEEPLSQKLVESFALLRRVL